MNAFQASELWEILVALSANEISLSEAHSKISGLIQQIKP